MNNKITIGLIGAVLVAAIVIITLSQPGKKDTAMMDKDSSDSVAMVGKDTPDTTERVDEAMMKDDAKMEGMSDKEHSMMEGGKLLAGTKTKYYEFTQAEYEAAVAAGKTVYLEFYADWCPICRTQQNELIDGMSKMSREDLVAFRVNYKDAQTDEFETALADKYKVPYQYYKIVLKGDEVLHTSGDSWDSETLVSTLNNL